MNRLSLAIGSILLGMSMTSHAQESTWDYTRAEMTGTSTSGAVSGSFSAQLIVSGSIGNYTIDTFSIQTPQGPGLTGSGEMTAGSIGLITSSSGAIEGMTLSYSGDPTYQDGINL